jgi:branched-chain amino acid transport system ATP-binding protein
MLRIEDLHVRYGRVVAVRGISIEVGAGEIVSLIGPNGAGKSTTLLSTVGVVSPSAGKILFENKSLAGESPEKIARRGIQLVPEGRRIFATLTVGENLRLGATGRKNRGEVADDLERVFRRFPILQQYVDTPAGKLSGGEQQQLAIGRALLARPRLLLLDEPSLGLAPLVVGLVFEALEQLRADGVTILLIEQNAARAIKLADRSYVMRSGRLEIAGTRDELLERTDLAEIYLGG